MFSLQLCCFMVVIIAFTDAGLTPEQIEAFQTVMNSCKTKTGATDDDLATMMKHDIPETTTGLCFAACVKKTLGIIRDDNSMDLIKIEEMLTPLKAQEPDKFDGIMKVSNYCATNVVIDPDECQAAKKILQCLLEQIEANKLNIDFMSMLQS